MSTERLMRPMMSGHCAHPAENADSHARCQRNGGGNRANPGHEFQPCPCTCHVDEERYECENCGRVLAEAPLLSAATGEDVYVHLDEAERRWTGEFC